MLQNKKVFVTHFEVRTCAGLDVNILWENIIKQKSGIGLHDGFLPQSAAIGTFNVKKQFKDLLFECVQDIVDKSSLDVENSVLFIGSSVGGMQNSENMLKDGFAYHEIDPKFHTIGTIKNLLFEQFKFKDIYSFSTACTSSANALGFAYECVRKGIYSNILVVGADAISLTTVNGFNALGVLSSDVCKPFCGTSGGMNVSEGIGALLVCETASYVELLGVGYSCDAHHMAHPHPEGIGAKEAMQNALKCAGLRAKEIDYINAHGTGTKANDTAESLAIASLFDCDTLVSSTKNITGHTLGAAGAIEAAITCKAVLEDTILPNAPIEKPINSGCNFALETIRRDIKYAMSNSFAFGGNNVSLIFGKA